MVKDTAFQDKLIKRLVYLWNLRDTDPRQYTSKRLGKEKEDIYCSYGSDNTMMSLAHDYYYNTGPKAFQSIIEEGAKYHYDIETDSLIMGR